MSNLDRSHELRPAMVLAVIAFLVFGLMVAGLATKTFRLNDEVVAWVGAGLVGIAAAAFAGWAVVIDRDVRMDWARRAGGDLLLAGLAFGVCLAGIATFAAGVI